jgi:hypothetical protein
MLERRSAGASHPNQSADCQLRQAARIHPFHSYLRRNGLNTSREFRMREATNRENSRRLELKKNHIVRMSPRPVGVEYCGSSTITTADDPMDRHIVIADDPVSDATMPVARTGAQRESAPVCRCLYPYCVNICCISGDNRLSLA